MYLDKLAWSKIAMFVDNLRDRTNGNEEKLKKDRSMFRAFSIKVYPRSKREKKIN